MKTRFIFSEVIERLKNSLKIKEDKEIAARLNMKAGTFNARKKTQSLPFEEILELAELEKLDYNWLLTGEGEIYKKSEGTMLKGGGANESFSDEDLQILRMIKRLPPTQKNYQVRNIEVFLQSADEYVRNLAQGGELRMAA